MYAQDSFFTLSMAGQIGLAGLSLCLSVALIFGVYKIRLPIWAHLLAGMFVFWAFVWLSPQIYYVYYLVLIDGLPVQSVIRTPPSPADMLRLYTFGTDGSLSAHGQAVLGWSLALVPAIKRLRRNAAN